MQPDNEVFTEWLAAAPKGVKWDKAQEMWEEYLRKRKEQAAAVARRLMGEPKEILAPCSNLHHGWGAHPQFMDCEDWQG